MSHNTIPSAQPPARRNQLDVLEDIAGGIAELVDAGGGGAGGPDKELITLSYSANKNFTGATQGDLITGTQVVDLSGASPVVGVTVWQNQTTRLPLASAPLAADIDLAGGGGGATNAQLVAALATQTAAINAGPGVVVGNVATDTADAGNPVKVGGVYKAGTTTLADGQRGNLQITQQGHTKVALFVNGANSAIAFGGTNADAITALTNTSPSLNVLAYGLHFNGTTWDRARGNTSGAFAQGNVASGVADVGNPLKVGGVYQAAQTALANNARANLVTNIYGSVMTSPDVSAGLSDGSVGATAINRAGNPVVLGQAMMAYNGTSFDRVRGDANGLLVTNMVYNGTGYDRMRGDTTGLAVNVLKSPLVARKIQLTAVSAQVTLTAGVKRISIYARGCDARFKITAATGTADAATDNFIAAGERLEFEMPNATPWLQAIAADLQSATGQLEITELS